MNLLYYYFIAVFVTVVCILLTITVFRNFGILDRPDGVRKIHKGEISLGGGIAIFLSMTLILYIIFPEYSPGSFGNHSALGSIWVISSIILFLGLLDDIRPMKPAIRLIVQIVASWLVIVSTDVYVEDLGNLLDLGNIQLGSIGIPVTIFMVVGVCNAFNMLDGMDGLVGFLLLIPGTFLAVLSSMYGNIGLLYLASIVLSVFLVFNLGLLGKSKKIFLGDSGSMWLGFITAWFLICLSQNESSFNFAPVSALWFVLIPLVDALSTFMTRIWSKKSIFRGDRSHLHHILIDAGLKKWLILVIFLLFSAGFSALGFFFIVYEIPEYYQFYGFLTVWFFFHLLVKQPMAIRDSRY